MARGEDAEERNAEAQQDPEREADEFDEHGVVQAGLPLDLGEGEVPGLIHPAEPRLRDFVGLCLTLVDQGEARAKNAEPSEASQHSDPCSGDRANELAQPLGRVLLHTGHRRFVLRRAHLPRLGVGCRGGGARLGPGRGIGLGGGLGAGGTGGGAGGGGGRRRAGGGGGRRRAAGGGGRRICCTSGVASGKHVDLAAPSRLLRGVPQAAQADFEFDVRRLARRQVDRQRTFVEVFLLYGSVL
mmetsp:Transcript_137448/g.439088  ORF Transcript_137448/g.439088 Transcript_137448/m.439088 type:complete len:242 (-) Transcript_137448:418-1143(-)